MNQTYEHICPHLLGSPPTSFLVPPLRLSQSPGFGFGLPASPGCSAGKESTCHAGDAGDEGLITGLERSSG